MPVGTAIVIATDEGVVLDAIVDRDPRAGRRLRPAARDGDRARARRRRDGVVVERARHAAGGRAGAAARGRATVSERGHRAAALATPSPRRRPRASVVEPLVPQPEPPRATIAMAVAVPAPEPAPAEPEQRGATTVMDAIDPELLAQLTGGGEPDKPPAVRSTGQHAVVDDGKPDHGDGRGRSGRARPRARRRAARCPRSTTTIEAGASSSGTPAATGGDDKKPARQEAPQAPMTTAAPAADRARADARHRRARGAGQAGAPPQRASSGSATRSGSSSPPALHGPARRGRAELPRGLRRRARGRADRDARAIRMSARSCSRAAATGSCGSCRGSIRSCCAPIPSRSSGSPMRPRCCRGPTPPASAAIHGPMIVQLGDLARRRCRAPDHAAHRGPPARRAAVGADGARPRPPSRPARRRRT